MSGISLNSKVLLLNNKVLLSNHDIRLSILNLTDKGKFKFTELNTRLPVHKFLSRQSRATSTSINQLAVLDSAIYPQPITSETETAFAIMSASNTVFHCVEHVFWLHALCNLCRGGASGGGGDSVVAAFVFGIIATLILGIFGSSLGSAILSSIKIYNTSQEISKIRRTNINLVSDLAGFRTTNATETRSKAAALVSLEANKETIYAYKNYRATKIGYLVCAIICSIALLALAAGAILGIFFSGPLAGAVITAAIIGCCAGGGSLLLIGFISFMIASVYTAKKQSAAVKHLHNATLYTMVADQMIHNPNDYDNNALSQSIVQRCISKYSRTIFDYQERSHLNRGTFYHAQQQARSSYMDPPPPYADLPPSYEEATQHTSQS
ncbi:hypothetical protein O1W69_04875 [Chlamydia sp. 12-01]|uniref:inclusion membrane protein GarD n=1 Tax=Chlamydia sp. 12-01 TaxID=3002742 RepID=UPI0035D4EC8A